MPDTAPTSDPTRPAGRGREPDRARRSSAVAAAIDALQGFCLGAEGRAAAASELRSLGLPTDADHVEDLCQEVLIRVWARLDRGDPTADQALHAGVVAYARRSLRNAAVDLLRAGRTDRLDDVLASRDRSSGELDPAGANDPSTDLDDRAPLPWSDDTADRAFAPEVRWVVQRLHVDRPRLDAWVASAALATTHLADHPGLDLLPDVPVPHPQSPAASAGSRWAGLAYAGRTDCWASPETGAVRQRRSVALGRLDRTLAEAIGMAGHEHAPPPGTELDR